MAGPMKERTGEEWPSFVLRSRMYQSKVLRTIICFGLSGLVLCVALLIYYDNYVAKDTIVLISSVFTIAGVHRLYSIERRMRRITVSFLYYALHSTMGYSAISISILLLPGLSLPQTFIDLYGNYGLILLAVLVGTESGALFLLRPSRRRYTQMARKISDTSIIDRLKEISTRLHIPLYFPYVIPGLDLRDARIMKRGLIHPRIYITDYLLNGLNEDESVALFTREYVHIKHHGVKVIEILVIIYYLFGMAFFFYGQYLISIYRYSIIIPLSYVVFLVNLFIPFLLQIHRGKQTLDADRRASEIAGKKTMFWAITMQSYLNMVPPGSEGGIYPSLMTRIRKLLESKDGTSNIFSA